MKNLFGRAFLLVIIFSSCARVLYSSDEGTATATFLRIEQGARPVAMGGAFTGLADTSDGLYYNPAAAAVSENRELMVSYAPLYQDITNSFVSAVMPLKKNMGSLGMTLTYVTFGEMEKMDSSGNYLGEMEPYNMAVAVYYGKRFGEVYFGGGIKNIKQDYEAARGSAMAIDAGVLFRSEKDRFSLGGSILNVGSDAKLGDAKNKLPTNIRGGASYRLSPTVLVAADLEKPADAEVKLHFGGEMKVSKMMVVRAGYHSDSDTGLTVGLGVKSELSSDTVDEFKFSSETSSRQGYKVTMMIDYAYVTSSNFSATHRISAGLKF
ncbi:MAG: hypothetical protein BWY26_01294 [Elusimicrobia bacterium ADurb.Bin231]|nr:MAG: hypothetical protein BWY26_01294 [Elusimicrobia bacterium ADurb.Bin231]